MHYIDNLAFLFNYILFDKDSDQLSKISLEYKLGNSTEYGACMYKFKREEDVAVKRKDYIKRENMSVGILKCAK
jgi:hypothetical protein